MTGRDGVIWAPAALPILIAGLVVIGHERYEVLCGYRELGGRSFIPRRPSADERPVVTACRGGSCTGQLALGQAGGAKNSSAIPSWSRKETPEP